MMVCVIVKGSVSGGEIIGAENNHMENTNEAISIACINGYNWSLYVTLESMLLDKGWWIALLGEEKVDYGNGETEEEYKKSIEKLPISINRENIRKWGIEGTQARYFWYWESLIRHINDGKNVESFFRSLLQKYGELRNK